MHSVNIFFQHHLFHVKAVEQKTNSMHSVNWPVVTEGGKDTCNKYKQESEGMTQEWQGV